MPVHWSQARASPRVTPEESDQQGAHLSASGCADPVKATYPSGARVCRCVCVFLQRNHRSPDRLFSHHGDHCPLVASQPKAEIGKRTLPNETIQDRFNLLKTL